MKFEKISFSIIGGDQRQIKLCNYLILHGYAVSIYGFANVKINPLVNQCKNLKEAIGSSDIIIGPIPCSQNERDLFTRYYDKIITVEEVISEMDEHQIFMAGRLTDVIQKIIRQYGIRFIDLLDRDDMAILNAIPTRSALGSFL